MTISDLIAGAGERLTPTERLLAEAVLADPTLLAFGTVTDLAERVGTSRPSVVRFAAKLGFGGFVELQEHVRAGLSRLLSRPSQRIRSQGGQPAPRAAIEAASAAAFEALEGGRLAALARPIAEASAVWIFSGETSRAGALALHSGLKMVRPAVHWVEAHSLGRDLAGVEPRDVAVVFDFARYRRQCLAAARALAERGVPLVAITDGPLSPLAALTETWCGLTVPAIGPFDSSVPAVIVAELVVAECAARLSDDARERIDRTEALWEATGTFEESP